MLVSLRPQRLILTLCALLGTWGSARADVQIPPAWADHAQTRALEELLHQAIQDKHTGKLSDAYAKIVKQDIHIFEYLQNIHKKGDAQAQEIALKMNPCHYAGMTIRSLIFNAYKNTQPHKGRLTTAMDDHLAQMFAENMDRCERLYKKPHTQRLIGNPTPR
jgi:hypothetical protein